MNDNQDLIQARMISDTHYEVLTRAATRLQEHLETIKKHEKELPVLQKQASDIFDALPLYQMFNTLVSLVEPLELKESWTTPEGQTTQSPPRLRTSYLQGDLPIYVQERDKAFLNYMQALKQEQDILNPVTLLYPKNNAVLTTTLAVITPFIKPMQKAKIAILAIQNQIDQVTAIKRSWYDYFRDSFLPLVYVFTKYEPFHMRLNNALMQLASAHIKAIESAETINKQFNAEWQREFSVEAPRKFDRFLLAESFLESMVRNYDHAALTEHFETYQQDKTVHHLLAFYRQACFLRLDDKGDKLSEINDYLSTIHPDMQSELEHEAQMVGKEHSLKTLIYDAIIASTSRVGRRFLIDLHKKYTEFLNQKNRINFYKLYHEVYLSQPYLNDAIRKDIKKNLDACYPEAVEAYKQQFVAHVDSKECQGFLKQYEKMNYDHPVYHRMIQFARIPTWYHFSLLEQELNDVRDQNYYLEPAMNTAMQQLINLCWKTSQRLEDIPSVVQEDSDSKASDLSSPDSSMLTTADVLNGLHAHHMFKHGAVDPSPVVLLGSDACLIEEQTLG